MPIAEISIEAPLAAARTMSDLLPYLSVMAAGFLIGAWGQSARIPIAVVAGIALVLIAVIGFMLDNSSGGGESGPPGIGLLAPPLA